MADSKIPHNYDRHDSDDDCCVQRDCTHVNVIAKNPRNFLLDTRPRYYDDREDAQDGKE